MCANTATTLRRGVQLLETLGTLAADEGAVSAAELARRTGIDRSLVFRTLQVLHKLELVERDPVSQHFRLGWRLFALASRAAPQRLSALVPSVLEHLSVVTGESAYFSVRQGDRLLTIFSTQGANLVQAANWIGATSPLTCTASGRALLTDCEPDALFRLLGRGPYETPTPACPATLEELIARIDEGRAREAFVARDELELGLVSVAAPVRDFRGTVSAVVNVSGPGYRLEERVSELYELVGKAARRLSQLEGPIEALLTNDQQQEDETGRCA